MVPSYLFCPPTARLALAPCICHYWIAIVIISELFSVLYFLFEDLQELMEQRHAHFYIIGKVDGLPLLQYSTCIKCCH
jgi:hypothetical protein